MRTKAGEHIVSMHACVFWDTFQSENLLPQSVHNGQQCHLIGHVEEVVFERLAGDGLNLLDKLLHFLCTLVLTIVVSQHLETQ